MALKQRTLTLVSGLLLSIGVSASSFEGSLSDESVKADLSISQGTYFFDAGGMYHTDDGTYGYVGAHIEDKDTKKDYPLQIGLGARLMGVDADLGNNDAGMALALGGFYRYTFPKANRFSLHASLYYAPRVLSFENINKLYQAEVRGEYRTLRNARVFVRYGLTSVDFSRLDKQHEMNNGVGIGVAATF